MLSSPLKSFFILCTNVLYLFTFTVDCSYILKELSFQIIFWVDRLFERLADTNKRQSVNTTFLSLMTQTWQTQRSFLLFWHLHGSLVYIYDNSFSIHYFYQ